MFLTKALLAFAAAGSAVLGAPSQPFEDGIIGPRQNTWYNKEWANDQANLTYENRAGGAFAVSWKEPNGGNFVVGKGYNPGRNVSLSYSGTFSPDANSNTYLALYGWAYNPTLEYYVVENFGVHHPADHGNSSCLGHFNSDGGTYEVWTKWQSNSEGQLLFRQLWAVRTQRRTGGTLTTGNFFKAWAAAGFPLNRQGEMIIGIEGQWGSGSATITAGVAPTGTVRQTATPTTRTNVPIRTGTCTAVLDIS
jgi:endo-1,4-beta-xylanase